MINLTIWLHINFKFNEVHSPKDPSNKAFTHEKNAQKPKIKLPDNQILNAK
jgi:hypothetical protein